MTEKSGKKHISDKVVARLCRYRQMLERFLNSGRRSIYARELAEGLGVSAAQVRRDLMELELIGTPQKGYSINEMLTQISNVIDAESGQKALLIGVGNLGKAILSYFIRRRPNLHIVAAFDTDYQKSGRVISGCRCYHITELASKIKELNIPIAIITTPEDPAQDIADDLVKAGIRGIVNFAPTQLIVPDDVYVENMDITVAIEKTAYFARLVD
jgi:redox-sensing transcriptional repressor